MGRKFNAERTTSYLLLFLDCRQVLVPARLLHRHRRTHQAPLRVQQHREVTSRHRETGVIQQNHKNKNRKGEQQAGNGRPFARSSRMGRGVHRQSRRHRNACASARFSGLRFETSYESGVKIKDAPYLYSIPERPKLRSMLANQDDKGTLQKTHR